MHFAANFVDCLGRFEYSRNSEDPLIAYCWPAALLRWAVYDVLSVHMSFAGGTVPLISKLCSGHGFESPEDTFFPIISLGKAGVT